jgi:SPP1 family predicted phage head-tail adaptor
MLAGRLRHRITIQEYREIGKNEWNEPIFDWADVATVWASVEPIGGREFWASRQVQSEVTHRIRIRHLPGLDPTMRILFRGREFKIEVIRNIEERNREMEILAVERIEEP